MESKFWLERWEQRQIGFHQDQVNSHLSKFWPELNLARGSEVFVPLCGKTRDMRWLREQGHRVFGVELSDIAVQEFFEENDQVPDRSIVRRFNCYEADDIRLLCGDFFDLTGDDSVQVTGVYDRASLVALPPEMRDHYARHLVSILPPATQILLVTFDYPQAEMQGPPFAVSSDEVQKLFRDYAEVSLLAQQDVMEQNPHFKARGLSRLQENIYLLTLR